MIAEEVTLDSLCETESLLGKVLNSLFDGVYIVDRDRRILFWNKGAEEITGFSAEEVRGRCCRDGILNHIDADGHLLCRDGCPVLQTFQTGESFKAKVYPLHKTGKRFPVFTHVAPIVNGRGEIIAAIEVFRDISQDEEFRILQEKFRDLISKFVSTTTIEAIHAQINLNGNNLSSGGSKSALKDLTILCLDMVGFTCFSEIHPPWVVVHLLNELFNLCEVITNRYQGDIDKFIGDALLAVFPDANDAVAASIDILNALRNLNGTRVNDGLEPISVRIGINSGLVVQGEIGTVSRKDLTVIGDAVNTAARIQQISEPDVISLSESTVSRLRETTGISFEQTLSLKGKSQPIRIYKVSGKRMQPYPE